MIRNQNTFLTLILSKAEITSGMRYAIQCTTLLTNFSISSIELKQQYLSSRPSCVIHCYQFQVSQFPFWNCFLKHMSKGGKKRGGGPQFHCWEWGEGERLNRWNYLVLPHQIASLISQCTSYKLRQTGLLKTLSLFLFYVFAQQATLTADVLYFTVPIPSHLKSTTILPPKPKILFLLWNPLLMN